MSAIEATRYHTRNNASECTGQYSGGIEYREALRLLGLLVPRGKN
jgi:hypothetical protein